MAACDTVCVRPAIVSVPVRDEVVVFCATVNDTVPLPTPLAPEFIVIHPTLLVADHAQPAPAVTVTDRVAPVDVTVWLVEPIAYVQEAGLCVTVKVRPAIVSVPVRDVVPVWAATVKLTVPLPVPLAPEVTEIQATLLVVVIAYVQDAAWVTVTVCPAIVSVPVRAVVEVFAATA
jgi:hypothetical protein